MSTWTRRDVVTAGCAAGAVALEAAFAGVARAGKEGPGSGARLFVVGPYSLAQLYRDKKGKERFGRWLAEDRGTDPCPTDKDVVPLFRRCKLYVIDQRAPAGKTGWAFTDAREYPQVAVVGDLFIKLERRAGWDFTLQLAQVSPSSVSTDETGPVPRRSFLLDVQLRVTGTSEDASWARGPRMDFGRCIHYDVRGDRREPR